MFKQTTLTVALLATGLFTSSGYTLAQQNPTTSTQQNPTTTQPTTTQTTPQNPVNISAVDRAFMIKAAQGNMGEIILGRLAAQRAVSPAVRQYGQRMVREHTQASNRLMQIAAQKGVTLPTETDAKHKALRARLGQIPGTRFDRTYMQAMVNDHSMTGAMFQRESRLGRDADVKAFASTTLPVVRNHLQMAIAMRDNIASR
jgi:putative membrane protein